jgi:hypothetical protein
LGRNSSLASSACRLYDGWSNAIIVSGHIKIAVKVVDIFGNDTMTIIEVTI